MTQRKTYSNLAFTMVELLVVVAIFAIVVATVVPSIDAFADQMIAQQAYETMAAQIGSAQALAPAAGTYTAVHVQQADGSDTARNVLNVTDSTSYIAVYRLNEVDDGSGNPQMRFQVAESQEARRVPGSMAFGEISGDFVNTGSYSNVTGNEADFTTFSIVFDPNGVLVTTADGGENVIFDSDDPMFATGSGDNVWNRGNTGGDTGEAGVRAFTVFRYADFDAATDKVDYLNDFAQFLPVMSYTGEVFRRE